MKRTMKIVLVCILLLLYTNISSQASITDIAAQSAILMDGTSGRVLYEKDSHIKLPMASTTKIMTAIVALEYGSLDEVVTIPSEASGIEGSSIWLLPGEKQTLENLLYGLMLRSGNDAATAIALHIGGTIENFAKMMNDMALKIGAKDSNFINPHGLHHDNHYTTAYDLALITSYGLKNPKFEEIVATKYKTIPWADNQWDRAMKNKNKMLWQYEGANGVKTGYTEKAGRCLVASAKRDGLQLVGVVLNCVPMFEECMDMLDYGYENYKNYDLIKRNQYIKDINIVNGRTNNIRLFADEEFSIALTKGEKRYIDFIYNIPNELRAPVSKGTEVGTIRISFKNEIIKEIPIISLEAVEKKQLWDYIKKIINFWG